MSEPPDEALDPIHEHRGQWWFWGETWTDRYGPYLTRHAAAVALDAYMLNLDAAETAKAVSDPLAAYAYRAITPYTRRRTERLIASLPDWLPAPQVSMTENEEVGLFWHLRHDRAEAMFDFRQNRVVWMGSVKSGLITGGDMRWNISLPEGLMQVLETIFKPNEDSRPL